MNRSNSTISKSAIMSKYSLSEREFEAIRRRTGERIQRAKMIYEWDADEMPSVNQLIDYAQKSQRGQLRNTVSRFEAILQTPAVKGTRAASIQSLKQAAANVTAGTAGGVAGKPVYVTNPGFVKFSENIKFFIQARSNLDKALNNRIDFEQLEHVSVGVPFGSSPAYFFKNTDVGVQSVSRVNSIIDWYNGGLANMYPQNALSRYLEFCRQIMEVIDYADENDSIGGS